MLLLHYIIQYTSFYIIFTYFLGNSLTCMQIERCYLLSFIRIERGEGDWNPLSAFHYYRKRAVLTVQVRVVALKLLRTVLITMVLVALVNTQRRFTTLATTFLVGWKQLCPRVLYKLLRKHGMHIHTQKWRRHVRLWRNFMSKLKQSIYQIMVLQWVFLNSRDIWRKFA